MVQRERQILERAVLVISEQAASASGVIDEALAADLPGDHPVTLQAKMLRLELLKVKADLERELETFSLNCSKCGLDVHWVSGLANTPGHWSHAEPAPHGERSFSSSLDSLLASYGGGGGGGVGGIADGGLGAS